VANLVEKVLDFSKSIKKFLGLISASNSNMKVIHESLRTLHTKKLQIE